MPKIYLDIDVIEEQLRVGTPADEPCQNCGVQTGSRVHISAYVLCYGCLHTGLDALSKAWREGRRKVATVIPV